MSFSRSHRSGIRALLLVTVVLGVLAYVIPASASHPEVSLAGSNFVRAEAPLLIETAALLQPNCRATSSISSSFARPSIGPDLT